ncbi:voltage-gated potassium channel regulatory subunit KCNG3 isoform X4 [Phaenicophaeus curvirostris]|uniref:voltage-gated potassium channel regulatory subunit KCNG3 isoform X4 n=1 Tax=Phaenicophaeus curvirostris TaxID=33595 RepID=UPI0037F09FB3
MNFGRGPSVVLNVGGTRYSFSREVLKDFPLRRVSRLHGCLSEQDVLEVCDDYDRERNEYFFDRHSEAFGFIMLYVRHGHLRFVPHMCELSFYNEMIYWGLEGSHLDYCCQRRLDDRMSETCTYYSAEEPPGEPPGGPAGKGRRRRPGAEGDKWLERMRRTFEEPTSSVAAQVLATVSILFVIVSMVVLCASTLPEWRAPENRSVEEQSRIIEAICIGWFTAECIVRFIVSKNKFIAKLCLRRTWWKVPSCVLLDWMVLWNNILASLEKACHHSARKDGHLPWAPCRERERCFNFERTKRRFRSPQPDWFGLLFTFTHKSRTKNGLNTEICLSHNYTLYHSKQHVAEVFQRFP